MTNGIRVTKSDFWKAIASYPRRLVKDELYCTPYLTTYIDVKLNKPIGSLDERYENSEAYELDVDYYHKKRSKEVMAIGI